MSTLDPREHYKSYLAGKQKENPQSHYRNYVNQKNAAGITNGPGEGESFEDYISRRKTEQEKVEAKRARVAAEKEAEKQATALERQRQRAEDYAKKQNLSASVEYAKPSQLGGTLKETSTIPKTTSSDTGVSGEALKNAAANRLRERAIQGGSFRPFPEPLRSEAEIQADIDRYEEENGLVGRLKSAWNETKGLFSGNIGSVFDTAKENQKKTQNLSNLYAEKDAAVLAEFEKLRSNPDFVNNSGYDSAFVRGTKATGNYAKNDSVQRYDFINGVDMTGTHYEYPEDSSAANEDVKNIFSPLLEGYSGVPVHLRTINDSERHLYNYIYKTQGAEAADKYIDALDATLAARYREAVTSGARETASAHPVLSSAATVLTTPARAAAFSGQMADYAADGMIEQSAPYNAAAYTGSAIREQVGKDIEKNAGGFAGKVGSFAYGLGMSMADSLATLPYGQQIAPLVLGSTAAADTVIASKDNGLTDGQAFMLGAVAAAAESLTEKYSVEALLDKTVLGKEGVKRYIAKNIITEATEETASEIANLAADILISKDKSEWNQSVKEYKKSGMTEGRAFGKAFLDQLLNVGLSALGGAISGGVMSSASAATDAAVKKAVNHAFKKNQGASYARRNTFDGVLHETAEPEVSEDVSDRDYRVINDLSTLASRVESDEDINSILTLLETTIDSAKNNEYNFDDIEFITKQAERIVDVLETNGNDIIESNVHKRELVDGAVKAPLKELPARLASLVEEVASETEPGNNAINATIDYLRGEIQERGRRISIATTPEGKRISEFERAALIELDKTLRSRRAEIEGLINEKNGQNPDRIRTESGQLGQEANTSEEPVVNFAPDAVENTTNTLTEPPAADTMEETAGKSVRLYRGFNKSDNASEKNLTQKKTVYDYIGHSNPDEITELAPLSYYSESEEDARNYANMDTNTLETYRQMGRRDYREQIINGKDVKDMGGMTESEYAEKYALDQFRILHGGEPNTGRTEAFDYTPNKVLDLTELGDTVEDADIGRVYRILSDALGVPESKLDDMLRIGDIVDADARNFRTFKLLRNVPGNNLGTKLVELAKNAGYDSIRYTEDGYNHYAIINDENGEAPGVSRAEPGRDESISPVAEVSVGETRTESGQNPDNPDSAEETAPAIRDFSLTYKQTKHTKTGEPLDVFSTTGKLSKDEYASLKSKMKEIGGYWSSYVKGFIVPADKVDAVSEFADVTGENTNRTVGETETTVGETETTVGETETTVGETETTVGETAPAVGESVSEVGEITLEEGDNIPNSNIELAQDSEDYSEKHQKVIEDYAAAIDTGLRDFINQTINGELKQNATYTVSTVSPDIAGQIQREVGVDANGWDVKIESRMATHIWNRHGENGQHDRSMANLDDIARIRYVIDNADQIERTDNSKAYREPHPYVDGKTRAAKSVLISKKVNGTYYVVEAIPDSSKKTAYIVSAFMDNKKTTSTADDNVSPAYTAADNDVNTSPDDNQASAPISGRSNSIVTQSSGNVNEEVSVPSGTPNESETEAAKEELHEVAQEKEAEPQSVTANARALESAILRNTISKDSVVYGRAVDGFSAEQRQYFVESLIDGVKTDSETIHTDIPYDGTFDIKNDPYTVANILDALHVKVNAAENKSVKKIVDFFKNSDRLMRFTHNGEIFITNGPVAVKVTEEQFAEIDKEFKKRRQWAEPTKNDGLSWLSPDNIQPITQLPYKAYRIQGGKNVVLFEGADGSEVFADINSVKFFDNKDNVWALTKVYRLSGVQFSVVVSMDKDANINGVIMPTKVYDASVLGQSAYKSKSKLMDSIGSAVAESESSDVSVTQDTSTETTDENYNRKEESNDERSVETEDRPNVQGLRSEVEETTETPDGVQEESEPAGGDRGDDGGRVSRTSDGDTDSGSGVQDSESDPSGESDTGADERDDSTGTGGIGTDADDAEPGREPVEKPSAPKKKTRNFSFGEEIRKYINGTRPRTRDNIEAIKTLFQIERENRQATAAEKEILAKYKGWGGLSEAFSNYMTNRELKELLSEEEYDAARRSTQNAHYTSLEVIEAMYKGMERMGFNGGNLLEPSMGTGNFFGMLPKKLANKTNLYGVEMDNITGRIARALYGDADVTIAPYQDVNYADGSFDAAVGNVPFSSTTYTYKGEKHMLHDYFFVKTLDKVKDGGVVMFITSTGTLDKANPKTRDAIAKQADLVAAFRLPSNAFKVNAGTEVTTDIVVLRKRPEGVPQSGETFFSVGEIDGIPINEYFVRHPENILGTLVSEKGMYANERTQVRADERDYARALSDAMNSLPKNILNTDMTETSVKVENDTQKSRFLESDSGISFYDSTDGTVTKLTGKKAEKAKHYMRLRDAYNGVIGVSSNPNSTASERKKARKNLEDTYDAFVKEYGKLNSRTVKSDLRGDSEYWMVSALEKKGKTPGAFEKSDIFTEDLYTRKIPEHTDSAHDALAVSLSTRGTVDLDYMAKLTGQSKDAVSSALSDVIVETPDGDWQLTALYLSGNVREKLETAEKAAESNPKFAHNAEILRAALPRQLSADEISPKLGASWIDKSYYEEFARSVFGVKPKLSYNKTTGTWEYEYLPFSNSAKYGVDGMKILIPTMNQKQITVRIDGKVDSEATAQQRQRQEMLKEDFNAWIFGTSERRTALENKFNRLFASWKGADFNSVGSYLTLEGVNPDIKLREYQKGAVARVVFGGDTLLAHGVGTGKTFEMIASAMECKRLGITHKNLFVVPNNKVTDFQSDIHKLYPGAKVMAVTEADFTKDRRAAMISALAANDYDIAVIGHSQFGFIPVSAETKRNALRAQIDEIEATVNGMDARQDRRTIKQLEKSKESLEKKLKELATRKDDTVNFESLGIDGLFVDEAHNFKALSYYTKLNVAGAKAGGASQRAQDMFEKTQYLHDIHGRVVFGTATPITNSVAEIYNMTRFVAPDALIEAGIESFDAWSANFGNIESKVEISPDGISFRAKERYSKFSNVNAMIGMFRRFADILRSDEVLKDLPKAKRVTVECESNDHLEGYLNEIQKRVDALRGTATKKDNMLLVTNDGRAAAIDLRLVAKQLGVPASELDLDGSKINRTVENVVEEYKGSSKNKGTQLVFLDYGMDNDPEKRYGVDLYSDIIRKLVAQGIPANEIVRLDKVDNKKLDELYEKVNSGQVRVLIGSTARMGEGLNVQKRLVALHHLNPPYRPSDIEQREGRIIRFGNENKDVRIYRYVQKRSFDSYMWQMLERKQIMINQAMSGGDMNEIDDVDEFVLSAAEAKALASGNPLLLEKSELDDRFSKLSTARSVFMRSIYNAQDIIASYPGFIRNLKSNIEGVQKNAEIINAHPFSNDFDIVLRGKSYTDRKAANEALTKILADGRYSVNKTYEIGSVRGMKLSFMQEGQRITLYLDGAKRIEFESGADNAARIVNALNKAGNPKAQLDSMHNHLAQLEKALSDAKELVGSTFPQQTEYDEVLARLNEVNRLMNEAAGVKAGGEIIDDEGMSDDFGGDDADDTTSSRSRQRPGTSQSRIEGKWGKGDKNGKKLKSVSDLKNEAERLFGVPINVGKVEGGRTVRGIYKTHANTIRTRVYGDLPTIAHELGHHFEKKYDLSYSPAVDELIDLYRDVLEDGGYNESLYPYEAVANYFAELMNDAGAARESAPEFSDYLDSVLSVADKKNLDKYVDMANEYHAADLKRRRQAQVKYRTEENSLRHQAQLHLDEFVGNPAAYSGRLANGFVRTWIDDIVDLKPFGGTYDLAMRERTAGSIIDGRLNLAFTDNAGNIIGKSLAATLAEGNITQFNRKEFDDYLIQRITLDRIEAAERGETNATMVYADPELQNKDSVIKAIADYHAEYPNFADAAEGIYAYRHNLLSIAVDAGVVSSELAEYLERTYPHYVPLFRVMDDKSKASSGKSGKVQSSPIGKFKGSGRDIYSPVENLMLQTASFSNAVLQNQVRQAFADCIDSNENMGWAAEKVEPDKYFDTVSTGPIEHRLSRLRSDALNSLTDDQKTELFDDLMELIGDSVGMWKVNPKQNKRIVTVMRNGQREYYEVHDEHVMDALNTLDHAQSHFVFEFLGKLTGTFKAVTTGSNPEFGFTNIPRDIQSGYISSTTTNNPFKYFGDYFAAFVQAVVNSKGYKEYLRNGGGFQGSYTADIGRLKQKYSGVIKNPRKLSRLLHGGVSLYTRMLDAGESASRYAEYKRARKLGIEALEAMRKSQEITVNFSRHGKASKELDKVIPYFNAAVQSMYHMYDVLFHGEKKTAAWVKFVSGSIVPSALMLAWNYILAPIVYSDDEEEEKILKSVDTLSTYNKNAYWCFYAGDGKFIRIAKPKDMTVFSTVITNMFEMYVRENPAAFYDYGTYLLETLVPPHSLDDFMIFGTKASLDKNETFTGSPIVPTAYQGLAPEMQYNENTSRLAIAVGSALNISPMKIDFVIDDLGGFVGDVMLSLTSQKSGAEIAKETFGLSDVISADSVYSNNIASLFYDAKEAYESSAKSYPKGHEKYDAYADYGAYKYGKIADLYSNVNKLIKKHQDSQATRAARDTLNTIIDSVNRTSVTEIDRAVSEIAEITGEKVADIAPYIVVPTSLKDKNKNEYILGPYDLMEYYLESQAYLEAWYYDILTAGYDAETVVDAMKAAKKEVKKSVDAHYLEVMQSYFN